MNVQGVVCRVIAGFVFAVCSQAFAADHSFGGYTFGDYYYIATGADKKQNGFQIRRIYLTWDMTWNNTFSGRVRLEANDGGFGNNTKMEPFVKHAYLRYRQPGRSVYVGLSGTPTWSISEKIWGYRPVEKTIMDLNRIASSADIGVAFDGRLDSNGRVNVHLMLANGNGQASEGDNNKKVYALLHLKPGGLSLTAYADWENRPGDQDRATLAGFLGRATDGLQGGIEGFVQFRNHPASNVQLYGISAFGSGQISARAKAFGRIDLFEPDDAQDNDRQYLIIGGIDAKVAEEIHLLPHVTVAAFQAPGTDAQITLNMTLFFEF